VSRRSVPKRKAGLSLDELLAAHAACEDRLGALMGRYSGSVVPASIMGADAAEVRKPTKRDRKEGIRSAFKPGGGFKVTSVRPIVESRFLGCARILTDEHNSVKSPNIRMRSNAHG